LLPLGTTGDRKRHEPLPQIGGKGLFTKELEDALLASRADFAVHSLKDLPTELPSGLVLAAIPRREDVRDAFISANSAPFAELPDGARVGTSSVRRAALLRTLRPDLRIEPLRGNLDTRLRAVRGGAWHAVVLAAAGLHRMGWQEQITEYFPAEALCPAVGQGALGIEARAGDDSTLAVLGTLEDAWARISTTAERALLRALGGGCQIPIAAVSRRDGNSVSLNAIVIRPDGSQWVQASEALEIQENNHAAAITAAERLGEKTAGRLLHQGARAILDAAGGPPDLPVPQAP
jgi:hydroxymethylbilane synthase